MQATKDIMIASNIPEETVSSEGERRNKSQASILVPWEDGDLIFVVEDEKMLIKSQAIPQEVYIRISGQTNYWIITSPLLNKEYCIVLYCIVSK